MKPRGPDRREAARVALGRAVTARRAELGMSRQDLAEAAGVSYSHLAEIENGKKNPSTDVLDRLAESLRIPVHRLWMSAETVAQEIAERGDPTVRPMPLPKPRPVPAAAPPVERSASEPDFESYDLSHERSARTGSSKEPSPIGELMALASKLEDEDVRALINLARRFRQRNL